MAHAEPAAQALGPSSVLSWQQLGITAVGAHRDCIQIGWGYIVVSYLQAEPGVLLESECEVC